MKTNIDKIISRSAKGRATNDLLYFHCSNASYNDYQVVIKKIATVQNVSIKGMRIENAEGSFVGSILEYIESFNLRSFYMHHCEMFLGCALAIVNLIKNAALEKLSLEKCNIITDGVLGTILASVGQSRLYTLKLKMQHIGLPEAEVMVDAIGKSQLVNLYLKNCFFAPDSLILIMGAIEKSSIKNLYLSNIYIDDAKATAIGACLENSQVEELCLAKCVFGVNALDIVMESIKKSQLLHLNLSFTCGGGDNGINKVCNCIENSSIVKLSLADRQFDDAQWLMLSETIKKKNNFVGIFFRHSFINVPILCDLLENSTIHAIRLQHCALTSVQAMSIIDSVKRSSVTSLDLMGNYIQCESIGAICNLLENHNLCELNLSNNHLDNETFALMLPFVKKSSLIKFDTRDNFLDHNLQRKIKATLQEQRNISNRFYKTKATNKNM